MLGCDGGLLEEGMGVCSESCRTWCGLEDLFMLLLFGLPELVAIMVWEDASGVLGGGGVGGPRADMRRVCFTSPCWERRRMLVLFVKTGCELQRWKASCREAPGVACLSRELRYMGLLLCSRAMRMAGWWAYPDAVVGEEEKSLRANEPMEWFEALQLCLAA